MQRLYSLPIVALLCGNLAIAENWPEFRGPRGDGHSTATNLPLEFSESQNIRWKIGMDGKAWSSPVIWGNQIWLSNATADGKKLFGVCVDADSGKKLHDLTIFEIEKPAFCIPFNSYASSTPVVEEGRVYLHFGSAGTACLKSNTGEVIWKRQDLPCNHFRAPGSSPIVWRDLLILTFDGFDYQYVAALNKQTGETVWKTDRNINYGNDETDGDLKKAFSTPQVKEINGVPTLVSPSAGETIAYDARDGKELWRARTGGYNAGCRPIFFDDLVVGHTEGGLRLWAIRADGRGDVTDSHIAWTFSKSTPTRPSPVVVGELMFIISCEGVATCLEAKTGKQIWQKRLEGDYSASPLYANGRIYFFSQDGHIPVIAAEREFQKLAENKLDDGFMASPAVIDDSLILRTRTHLYRVENR